MPSRVASRRSTADGAPPRYHLLAANRRYGRSDVIGLVSKMAESVSYGSKEPLERRLASFGVNIASNPSLPELLGQIPPDEPVLSVSGDGAYDTQACHDAIALRGAQAVIPTRKNAQPWKARRPGAAARNEIVRATRRLGHAIWKQWSGYHRRSLVETKMRCFKLLGERVMARTFERQVVELQEIGRAHV